MATSPTATCTAPSATRRATRRSDAGDGSVAPEACDQRRNHPAHGRRDPPESGSRRREVGSAIMERSRRRYRFLPDGMSRLAITPAWSDCQMGPADPRTRSDGVSPRSVIRPWSFPDGVEMPRTMM
jgi:hypothetical protein